jgi:hypothetical protein
MKKFLFLSYFFLLFTSFVIAQTVYITKTGKKYHRESCSSLRLSSIPINLKDAIAQGYTPCSRCKPPIIKEKISKVASNKVPKVNASKNSGERIGCICRNGTRSYATGRGACSHHGGVEHWLYK